MFYLGNKNKEKPQLSSVIVISDDEGTYNTQNIKPAHIESVEDYDIPFISTSQSDIIPSIEAAPVELSESDINGLYDEDSVIESLEIHRENNTYQ